MPGPISLQDPVLIISGGIGSLAAAVGLQWAVIAGALLALAIVLVLLPSVRRQASAMEAE